ncbi:MAG: tetratricopeptide repeat protein [Aggregatilineales bacterium]
MSDDVTQAVAAYNAGDHAQAGRILTQVVKEDKTNAQAWYYLGLVQADPAKRRTCFERVLKLEPEHELAQAELAKLGVASRPENVRDIPKDKPQRKSAFDSNALFSNGLLSAIPGAPPSVSIGTVTSHAQTAMQQSIPVFTGQAEPHTTNTWWDLFLSVSLVSFLIGVLSVIDRLVLVLKFELGIDLFSIIFPPILAIFIGLAGVSAGCFFSHWYITRQEGGTGSLLSHSSGLVSVWVPASIILAIFVFLVSVLNTLDVFNGGIVSLERVLVLGIPRMSGLTLIFTILAGGIAVYAMFLMSKFLVTIHAVNSRAGWIAAFIMVFITALVF